MTQEKLPRELVEEILFRVPPLYLTRFKTICKQWNTILNDKIFITNHLAFVRPQFILYTEFKTYLVCVNLNGDPTIERHELPFHIPSMNKGSPYSFISCDGLLFCSSWFWNGAAVWNPWLRQTRWIESKEEEFKFFGLGYDSGKPEKGRKILGYGCCQRELNDGKCQYYRKFAMYSSETNAWKCIDAHVEEAFVNNYSDIFSLNGTLYWLAYNKETAKYAIHSFDFSKEIFKIFCIVPLEKKSFGHLALSVFRRDRFSMLGRNIRINKIEVWLTKNKINEDGEDVAWVKFMTVSIPGFTNHRPSYFIDHFCENSLIMCCEEENGKGWIYIVKGNVSKKIDFDFDLEDSWFDKCLYTPSLISVTSESVN